MMSTTSLTSSERGSIYAYRKMKLSVNQIAIRLGRAKSTIYEELQRVKPYNPDIAQAHANKLRSHCGRHSLLSGAVISTISNNLKRHSSPEGIAHAYGFGISTIYHWAEERIISDSLFPEHGRRRRRKSERRGRFPITHTIDERPDYINNRSRLGDWEVDTILSPRGEDKACLVTFVERKTRLLYSFIIKNRTHQALAEAMAHFMKYFRPYVKSITTDNGREFSHNCVLQGKYKIPFYFCHPYSPQERGSNERLNRRLREFFPKKTDFSKVSQGEVFDAVDSINKRHLKVLNWETADEAFHDELFKLRTGSD